jgi:general stress protein YciG
VQTVPSKDEIREYFAKFGRKGGKATAKNRTPEERKAAARKAVKARWAKAKKAPK